MVECWRDKTTFITGATGLLGGWLVKDLLNKKADIVCLVRDWIPESQLINSGMLNNVKIIRGNLEDQSLLERILGEYEVEVVFHLAAQTIVGVANRNPISTFESDIKGTWALLEACRRSPKVKSIVVASSDKCYRADCQLPYIEDMPLGGDSPYDVSKSCVDLISQSYAKTYKMPIGITRCGNFYGGGDLNWNRIVPGTIRSIIRNERPIIRSDGKYIRDYLYIEDAVSAYELLAENILENPELFGQAFNFSSEKPLEVLDIVNLIIRMIDSKLEPIIKNEAGNEIRKQYLSSQKAHLLLRWWSSHSIDEGLKKTINWYLQFFEISNS